MCIQQRIFSCWGDDCFLFKIHNDNDLKELGLYLRINFVDISKKNAAIRKIQQVYLQNILPEERQVRVIIYDEINGRINLSLEAPGSSDWDEFKKHFLGALGGKNDPCLSLL